MALVLSKFKPEIDIQNLTFLVQCNPSSSVTASSWVLTLFSHTKALKRETVDSTFRVWDYIVCSPQSTQIFLIAALILNYLPHQIRNFDIILDICQKTRDSFQFLHPNTEPILKRSEHLKKKFRRKKAWVSEFNELLPLKSSFRIEYLPLIQKWGLTRIIPSLRTLIFWIMLWIIVYFLCGNIGNFILGTILFT